MGKSADGEGPATTASAAAQEIHQRKSSRVPRRLVQSTLLPHKSPAIGPKGEQKDDKECNAEVKDGEDEESCGSQAKKKRTRKRKENTQTTSPKVSKRAKVVSSSEATPKRSKGSSVKGAGRKNATPKKNVTRTPKKNGTSIGKNADHSTEHSELPQIPNLRLEAKMMAEENSRVFGGKQVHPFFLSQNATKIGHKTDIQMKPKRTIIGPIHVFEREQDDVMSLDWREWKKFFSSSIFTPEGSFSSIFECTVKSLSFDEFPSVLYPTSSHFQDSKPLDECLPQQEILCEASATAISSGARYQHLKDAETDYQIGEAGLLSGCVRKSDAEQQTEILQERMSSHPGCANQLDNRTWTSKYQPKKAMEVCGNYDSVKFLNEWLGTWHQRGWEANKASSFSDDCYMQDPDYNCCQSDSDSENICKKGSFKNVLLITGPVGSGKSAAIYACAKEQGFKVLEFNTSECRNGAAVKDRFAVLDSQSTLDSQLLQWSQESSLEFQIMDIIKHPAALSNSKMVQEIDGKVVEVIPIADGDISHEATETSEKFVCKDSSVACSQSQLKPLILFEDVDVIFSEDRGFISAIKQISDKVKWPVILTRNSDEPVLPDSLDRQELCFKMPSEKELFEHLRVVCSAENANVQPHLVEQLIKICQRDIRKIIMNLQFWCQGEQFRKGNQVRKQFGRMTFDLEDGYQILPKIIPWDFPCQLSELVEKEITMSLRMMEENDVFIEVIEDKFNNKDMQSNMRKHIYEIDSIEAKKKAMLSKHCSDHDCMDFIPPFNPSCDLFDSSDSPVPFSRTNSKRKLVVMSSDSEDDRVPTSPDISNGFSLENGIFASHHLSMQKGFSPSTDLQVCSESAKPEENLYLCSETVHLNVRDTSISVDVSCVPESSYVPETEIDGAKTLFGRVFCGQMGKAEILEEASVSNEFRHNIFPADADNFDESMHKLGKDSDFLGSTCDVIAVSSHEEGEYSQNDLMESITREHQLMDECSCIDFNRKFNQHEKGRSSSSAVIDTVKESWRKLRNRRADLRHLAAAEHKYSSGSMKLACGMSNLISEAELLQAKCQALDSSGSPMVFSEESDAFSWGNEQLQMASTILQHGFCVYARDIVATGLNMGYKNNGDLTCKELSSTTKMKVSNSLLQNSNSKTMHVGLDSEITLLENGPVTNREQKSKFISIIQSVVPSRAYMTMKGDALYEYISSLGHIAKSESSRLFEGDSKAKRRRGRAARNYLSTGSLMLSPEEISLLGQSSMYGKISSQA